jgi:hypothetical protein
VLLAVDPGKTGNQNGLELHGVQVAPLLFGGMVIDAAGCLAFRAFDVLTDILELDGHPLVRQGEIHVQEAAGNERSGIP